MHFSFIFSVLSAAILAGSVTSAGTVVFDPNGSQPQCANTILVSNLAPELTVAVAEIWVPGSGCVFPMQFVAKTALRISDIALSATGTAANIGKVRFGLTPATTLTAFGTIVPAGRQAFGGARLPGGTLARGDIFTIHWDEGISAAFTTSAIPLPAALPLLAGALGVLGLARRKARKAA